MSTYEVSSVRLTLDVDEKETRLCEVCNKNEVAVVCCSSLWPISYGYCRTCADSYAEPYGPIVGGCALGADYDEEWLASQLELHGKSREEFDRDVAESKKQMEEDEEQYEFERKHSPT